MEKKSVRSATGIICIDPCVDEANGIAIDDDGGHTYVAEAAGGKIQRADLDGANLVDLVVGLSGPTSVALALCEGRMYWTNSGDRIERAFLDGSGRETTVSGDGSPWGIAVFPGDAMLDCNGNGVPDPCELNGNDCNRNGIPDDCDPDCDGDGIPDDCDSGGCSLGDLDGDCDVDLTDLSILLGNFGRACPQP